jgi:hypothetical protein
MNHNSSYVHYNALLTHLLTFLQTDLNPFFLIGAVMPWDPRSSTSKCEALLEDMEVSMKTCATVVEFANRVMHRCYHFHRL